MNWWRRTMSAAGGIVVLLGAVLGVQALSLWSGYAVNYGPDSLVATEALALVAVAVATMLLGLLLVREASRPRG